MVIISDDLPLPGRIVTETILSVFKFKDGFIDTKVELVFDNGYCIIYTPESDIELNSLGITNPDSGVYTFDSKGNYTFDEDDFDEDQYQW